MTDTPDYTPPKVWTWNKGNKTTNGRFANINRPTAGAQYEKELPVGRHPLQLYSQMGSTPYVGGGFGHFYAYAPVKIEYPIERFAMETKRLLDVLDKRLAESEYVAGLKYTIADIAIWPWYGGLAKFDSYEGSE